MAVVKLLPRKAASAQGRRQSMEARLDYDGNPDKTREGECDLFHQILDQS